MAATAQAAELPHISTVAPGERFDAQLNLAVDYAQAGSLLYKDDDGRQAGGRIGVTARPFSFLQLKTEYRSFESRNNYVYSPRIRSYGDTLFSATAIYEYDTQTALGWGLDYLHYTGISTPGGASRLLATKALGPWALHGSLGWKIERPAMVAPVATPFSSFAAQKAARNSWNLAAAAYYNGAGLEPFVVYSLDHYVGASLPTVRQPQRATFGAHLPLKSLPIGLSPSLDVAVRRPITNVLPVDPPWRARLDFKYELPIKDWWQALFPPPGTLIGDVADTQTKNAISNLEVRVNGTLVPNSANEFSFTGAPGTYTVTLKAPAYVPHIEAITIEPNKLVVKQFRLQRNRGFLLGTVILGARPGVAYYAMNEGVTSQTGKDGSFVAEVLPGNYALEFTAPGYQRETRLVTIEVGGSVNFQQIRLQPENAEVLSVMLPGALQRITESSVLPPPSIIDTRPNIQVATPEHEAEREWRDWMPPDNANISTFDSPLFFALGSAEIDPRALPSLRRLAKFILENADIDRVIIEGRADVSGSEAVNLQIASGRASAVYRYLVESGVSKDKLATTKTIYEYRAVGQSAEQKALDRRVGFRLEKAPR